MGNKCDLCKQMEDSLDRELVHCRVLEEQLGQSQGVRWELEGKLRKAEQTIEWYERERVDLDRRVVRAENQRQILGEELYRVRQVEAGAQARVLGKQARVPRRGRSADQGHRGFDKTVVQRCQESRWSRVKDRVNRLFDKPLDEVAEEYGLTQGKRRRDRADTA